MPERIQRYLAHVQAADGAALLVGAGGGCLIYGLAEYSFRLFDPTPTTWRMVLGMAFLACAAGLRIPHRLATWLAARTWRRLRGGAGALGAVSPYASFWPGEKDRPLLQTVLAAFAMLCGASAIGSFGMVRMVQAVHEFMLTRFLWGSADGGLLLVLEGGLVATVVVPVFVLVGLTWSCVHHLACPVGGWRVRPLAGVSAGLALTSAVAALIWGGPRSAHPDLFLLTGALGFFLLSVLSARASPPSRVMNADTDADVSNRSGPQGHAGHGGGVQRARSAALRAGGYDSVPRAWARWTVLIQAAVVIAGGCAVASAGLWWRVFGVLAGRSYLGGAAALATWGLGFAAGVAAACILAARRTHSIGALGLSAVAAGFATASAAGLLGALGLWSHRAAGHVAGGFLLAGATVGLSAFALGHAVTYGWQAVLARTGHHSAAGSAMLSRVMLAGGGVVGLALTPLILAIGTYAALVGVSLALLGLGGGLIIHEPGYLPRTRRLRLTGVFGSILILALVLPHAAGGWLLTRPWKRVRLDESAWLTRSVWAVRGEILNLPEPGGRDGLKAHAGAWLPRAALEPAPTGDDRCPSQGPLCAALLGPPPPSLAELLSAASGERDRVLFDPSGAGRLGRDGPSQSEVKAAGREPATRFLRRTPRRFDLIAIAVDDAAPATWSPAIRAALLGRALNRLRPDGVVLLTVPLGQCSQSGVLDCLDAIRAAHGAGPCWATVTHGHESALWLAFGKDPLWRARWDSTWPWLDGEIGQLIAGTTAR